MPLLESDTAREIPVADVDESASHDLVVIDRDFVQSRLISRLTNRERRWTMGWRVEWQIDYTDDELLYVLCAESDYCNYDY